MRWIYWLLLLGGLSFGLMIGCGGGGRGGEPPAPSPETAPLLFSEAEQKGWVAGDDPGGPVVIRQRWVQVRHQLLTGPAAPPAVTLNLFPQTSLVALRERLERGSQGSLVWVGHLQGIRQSEVYFAVKDEVVIGNIQGPDCFYQVRYAGGSHLLCEVDPHFFPPCAGGIAPPRRPIPERRTAARSRSFSRSDNGSLVDVLVVYTEAAKNGAGGQSAMEALIDLAESETNQGYVNSQVVQRIRVVHTQEVVYDEADFDWEITLEYLTWPDDSYLDEVHPWRDAYAADEVVLLVNNSKYGGIAWLMDEVDPYFSYWAFAVVSRKYATGYYSFAHEMGHNMGCHHDRDNAGGAHGAYPYSYGYRNANFRTIMAYGGSGIGPRINHWSNPEVLYNGEPTGIPEGDPLAADNAKTLNNTRFTVANFRDAPNLVPTLTDGRREPDQGEPGDSFTYRVTYTDADNDPPSFIRVHLKRNGRELAGSPYVMSVSPGRDGDFTNGEEYQYVTSLSRGGEYACWFEASDGTATVQTGEQPGPSMWEILVAEDFEGSFPTVGWWAWDQDGLQFGEYFWGLDDSHPRQGRWALWCAAGGSSPRIFGGYPNHCQSWLVYGPFSLSDAAAADLSFFYEGELRAPGDTFFYGYSTDGQNFKGEYLTGSSKGYVESKLDLRPACGKRQVWIAFLFVSDATGTARGVWIDDLILRRK